MYAVVKTGGKQYKLSEDDMLRIEKIDAEVGEIITLDEVLLVANDNDVTVGSPLVEGASVAVEILSQRRARKIVIFKKRRRKSSRTKNGHRQHFTLVRVSEVLTNGAKPTKEAQGMPEKKVVSEISEEAQEQEVAVKAEKKPAKSKKAPKPKVEDAPNDVTSNENTSTDDTQTTNE